MRLNIVNKNLFLNKSLLKIHSKIRLVSQRTNKKNTDISFKNISNKSNKDINNNLLFLMWLNIYLDTENNLNISIRENNTNILP